MRRLRPSLLAAALLASTLLPSGGAYADEPPPVAPVPTPPAVPAGATPSPAPPPTSRFVRDAGLPTLVAIPVDAAPAIDGDGSDAAWRFAPALVVRASPAFAGREQPTVAHDVEIEMRACIAREDVTLLLAWSDACADSAVPGDVLERGDSVLVSWDPRGGGSASSWKAGREPADGSAAARGRWKDGRWTLELRGPPLSGEVEFHVTRCDGSSTEFGCATATAVLRRGRAARVLDFDGDVLGAAPKGVRSALAGTGAAGDWRVRAGGSGAGSGAGQVLVQESGAGEGARFPLAMLEGFTGRDVDVSVRFQARAGVEDRGAGVVWRATSDHDFYVVRANALERNVVPYVTRANVRTDLRTVGAGEDDYGVDVPLDPAAWHVLRATMVGDRLQAYVDGRLQFAAVDGALVGPGAVGLWTKADSVMAFDDFVVVSLDAPAPAGR